MMNYFNTSYVVIKQCLNSLNLFSVSNFNTSYVVIKRPLLNAVDLLVLYFNTSYVVIKLKTTFNAGDLVPLFQYILCCY